LFANLILKTSDSIARLVILAKPPNLSLVFFTKTSLFRLGKMTKNYLNRKIDRDLLDWTREKRRKPLLLRGARQVGKSSAVRHLARRFEHFLEVNFESDAEAKELFEQRDVGKHERQRQNINIKKN
jgi:predicted AAA+ superfamily ATPase